MDVAEQYHISQSSCSKAIMHLEDEFGVKLFDRSGRAVKVTAAGKQLYLDLQEVLPAIQKIEQHMGAFRNGESISICIIPSLSSLGLPTILDDFNQKYPSVRIQTIRSRDYTKSLELLEDGSIQFIVMHEPTKHLDFSEERFLHDDKLLVLFPPGHPLAKKKNLSFADLTEEHFLLNDWGKMIIDELSERTGMKPSKVTVMNATRESILLHVYAGKGIGLFYASDLSFYSLNDVTARSIKDIRSIPWVLISNRNRLMSDAQNAVADHIIQSMSSVIMPNI
jgi:DNA-binding transcriptional LysR family regulator